nr:gamma-glutamylcyclotransferase family protein [Mangrovicella endophytica]
MADRLYFAYGSNLSKAHMAALCPGAEPVGAATLADYRLVFRTFADIEPAAGCNVVGGLWRVTAACEAALDAYENLDGGLYRRIEILPQWLGPDAIPPADGQPEAAPAVFAYRMNEAGYAVPANAYLAVIEAGYRDFGLPVEPLVAAAAASGVDAAASSGRA